MDIKILFSINVLILFVVSMVLVLHYRKNKENKTIKYLTYFILLHFIGFVFFVLRNQTPDFFSIILSNMLFAAGTLCFYLAIKTIVNKKTIWHNRYYIPVFIFFLGFITFTYLIYDTKTRIMIYYFYCAIYLFPSAWILWKNDSARFQLFDKITAVVLFIISFIFTAIIIQSTFIKLQDYYFSNNNLFMILSIIIIITMSLWTLLVLKYRLKKED